MPEKNQDFGLDARTLSTLRKILGPFQSTSQVFVFGSRARGDHRPYSDIDILVRGPKDPAILSRARIQLDESDIPYKVDLVHESDLAEDYRYQILSDLRPMPFERA